MGEYTITINIRLGNNGNASIKEFPESIIDEGRLLVMGPPPGFPGEAALPLISSL